MAIALTLPPDLPGMPPALLPLLVRCSAGCRIALVGGAVRDLLLHRLHHDAWRGVPDLDLVVEGRADEAAAAPRLARSLAGAPEVRLCDWREHGAYGTVELELELRPAATAPAFTHPPAHTIAARPAIASEPATNPEPTTAAGQPRRDSHRAGAVAAADSDPMAAALTAGPAGGSANLIQLDLATARREEYLQAADNPRVRFGRLEDDLGRRDFTINAMALLLGDSLLLLDPHGGLADLRHRQLRFLHGGSVRDDPTRLLRAARYGARLGFQLADCSREQARATLAAWPWRWRHGDPPAQAPPALGTRLRMELQLLLEREPWPQALAVLQDWGALILLDPALQIDRRWRRRLRWAERLGLERMTALLAVTQTAAELAERLQLPHRQQRLLVALQQLRIRLDAPDRDQPRTVVQWCRLLEAPGGSAEAVALALAAGIGPRRPLLRWWLRWRHIRAPLSASELIATEGLRPGPALGARLHQLREQRLATEGLR